VQPGSMSSKKSPHPSKKSARIVSPYPATPPVRATVPAYHPYTEIAKKILSLSDDQKAEILSLLNELDKSKERERSQNDFLEFVKSQWPAFIEGEHHRIMSEAFAKVSRGECKRMIINMAPRHTKSEFASYMLPAWFMGNFPNKKIIQCSNTAELAVGFGRKVRNLVGSEDYRKVFPDVDLQADSKAAGRWSTNQGGEYFAIGVGGTVTGKGADLLIIDDPHSEQEAALGDPSVYDKTYEWYTSGPRQRLQPGAAIIVVMTRWHKRDLTGRILKSSIERGSTDEWEVIELPAIMPSGNPLWPEFWSIKELEAIRAELPLAKWQAQYQQDPTSEEGALVKREWWRVWEKGDPPICDFVIQSWDTAFTKKQTSDFSACTTWGVFKHPNPETGVMQSNIILLDAIKERMEFPELKKRAMEMYRQYSPDAFIVEAKAAGAPLIYELRAMGIPVSEFTPSRGNDKIARVNAVSDLFSSGVVWSPPTRWAEEVVEEFAAFPNAEHDDLVDSSTQALLRFRQGGFIAIDSDEREEKITRRRFNYY
jgi:predicted phage terminase large subunit-like protein